MENKKCEICNERDGQLNSHYSRSNENEQTGDWVCSVCEERLGAWAASYCPCGCNGDMNKCVYAQNHHQTPKRDEYVDAVNSLIVYFNRNSPGNIQYDKLQSYIRRIEACSLEAE
jgi:hypothetical protein